MVIFVRMGHSKVILRQHHLSGVHTIREVMRDAQINVDAHMQKILLDFARVARQKLYARYMSCKNIEVHLGHRHAGRFAAQVVRPGHAVVFAAAQHQVAE